jgi:hypothetical protein
MLLAKLLFSLFAHWALTFLIVSQFEQIDILTFQLGTLRRQNGFRVFVTWAKKQQLSSTQETLTTPLLSLISRMIRPDMPMILPFSSLGTLMLSSPYSSMFLASPGSAQNKKKFFRISFPFQKLKT